MSVLSDQRQTRVVRAVCSAGCTIHPLAEPFGNGVVSGKMKLVNLRTTGVSCLSCFVSFVFPFPVDCVHLLLCFPCNFIYVFYLKLSIAVCMRNSHLSRSDAGKDQSL